MIDQGNIKQEIDSLKKNFKSDISAGFFVFLLALPLSLGIAKASGFPASMGVLTAIIGGVFTLFFRVSELSIKGPAAGLITISAAAVTEFGGNQFAWQTVCAIIVTMAVLQIFLGFLKFGSLTDFFPHSAVHGMLAAIGIIIMLKQFPVLLGVDPSLYTTKGPIELLISIPMFLSNFSWHVAIIGIISLLLMFVVTRVKKSFLRKIPAPVVVLLVAIPMTLYWDFKHTEPEYTLVIIGDFWGSLGMNANFSAIGTFVFWKYVIMFLFVSSLESLLTVKAIDGLDPYNRKSDYNGDLIGQGAGNVLTSLLGGLPMISEVVRSSANVGFGAKTKWSNFFHGVFLLLAMIFLIPFIELIPNSALAAMLIYAGFRLAAPKEFIHTYKIGKEQLAILLVTIILTLAEDLLLGVLAGILVKFIFHFYYGVKVRNLFQAKANISNEGNTTTMKIENSAIFSNLISFKKMLSSIPENNRIIVDFSEAELVDHSFMSFIHHFQSEKVAANISCQLVGFENHKSFSDHRLSAKKRVK
jgi:MFS superfamily sulfate permease-like transporter